MDANLLATACRQSGVAISEALTWTGNPRNERKLSQDRTKIDRVLRRNRAEARRLEHTLSQPACVGIFGPSQAGKSYLISVLARREGAESMVARFDGDRPEIDFIRDINPLGGEEATGLVTRFTLRSMPTPPGFPVCLRLLNQCDVIKILVNSYYQDGDQEYETALDPATLEAHLQEFSTQAQGGYADVLREEDIWDVHEYVTKNSSGASTARAIDVYWHQIAQLAPRLALDQRAALLSILWGRHKTYTDLCVTLLEALSKLQFASDAFCEISGLIPATDGILNVKTLDCLLKPEAPTLTIKTMNGPAVEMPRAVVTALAAELRIVCRDEPRSFFDNTDLLDFPGYRSRTRHHLEKYLRDAPETAPKELFLRGKVDYLFQNYTANLELTSLVLCLPDSNLEVTSLPKAIENWIDVTHGATPEKRVGKPTLLFFALTKFDRHLMESAGDEGNDPALRFEIRLNASLLSSFAKIEPSWPRQWTPGQAFDNLYWIRNPNFKAEHVIDYEERKELQIIPERLPRIAQLRRSFIASSLVKTHFRDPERSWDEVMRLNDGGVTYLANALSIVSTEDLKLKQVAARLSEIRRETFDLLRSYYIDDDFVRRRAERLAVVDDQIFLDLNECAERMSFGTALRGLMLDASDLYGAVSEALSKPQPSESSQEPRTRGLFTGIVRPQSSDPAAVDRWDRIAAAALNAWTNLMFTRADDAVFCRRVGIRSQSLKEIVTEIGSAARRAQFIDRIAHTIRERATPNENLESIVRKVSLITGSIINRFVAQLDFESMSATMQQAEFGEDLMSPVFPQRIVQFDVSSFPAERPNFARDYMIGWGTAFRATVAKNAVSRDGGVEDPQENAKLGEILKAMAA